MLIDQNDRVQITDFGLAMRVEGDSELTRTGQILGTPSYMPPEQAQHKRGLIGAGSDVYSMGAILYELLTGRPPFRAESAVETLRQVIETEPLSPRQLNPTVPKDLETICLKCLEKEPHKRYATAEHLAHDLGRFQEGEPILARPIGQIERVWRWCRRSPVVAGLVATVAVVLIAGTVISSYFAIEANKQTGQALTAQQEAERLAGDLQDTIKDLNEKNAQLRESQARIAELIGNIQNWKTRDAVPPLIEGLRHLSPELRLWSATALGEIGDAASKAVPQLLSCLHDPSDSVRKAACISLGKIGPKANEAVSALEQIVKKRDAATHKAALNALAQIDPESPMVASESRTLIQKLVDLAERYDRQTGDARQKMVFEITRLGQSSVPALREIIADTGKSSQLRRDALWILANLESKAKPASPQIESLLHDSDERIREIAETALVRIDPNRAAELGLESHDASNEIAQFNTARGHRERDWVQLGGTHSRNNTPVARNLPTNFDVDTEKNIKWKAELGSQSYGNLAVANGKIFIGTNNGRGYIPRYPRDIDLGVLLCFDEREGNLLWQYSSPKLKTGRVHDWPLQGICSTPYIEGDRLWFVTNRCEVVCLDTEGFRDGENDGFYTEETNDHFNEADVVWKFDMMGELGVSPHNMSTCAPTAWGEVLFVCTSNGLDESHRNLPAPDAPSFIAHE